MVKCFVHWTFQPGNWWFCGSLSPRRGINDNRQSCTSFHLKLWKLELGISLMDYLACKQTSFGWYAGPSQGLPHQCRVRGVGKCGRSEELVQGEIEKAPPWKPPKIRLFVL